MKRFVKWVIAGLLLWFSLHLVFITIDGWRDQTQVVDVGVVLGNKVELDGKPSARLQARLDKAAQLYKEGYFAHVIASGGVGAEGFDEANVMKQYLLQKGIPAEAIMLDSQGVNTRMTAQHTKTIMDDSQFTSAMIITQFYHVSRTKLAFHQAGIEVVASAHADYVELRDVYSLVREFFAYYKYLFLQSSE